MSNKIIDVDVLYIKETDAAYCFALEEDRETDMGTVEAERIWVPKSLCEYDERDKVVSLPENIALEKGMI